jgi:excisionase family DNA binding protein
LLATGTITVEQAADRLGVGRATVYRRLGRDENGT